MEFFCQHDVFGKVKYEVFSTSLYRVKFLSTPKLVEPEHFFDCTTVHVHEYLTCMFTFEAQHGWLRTQMGYGLVSSFPIISRAPLPVALSKEVNFNFFLQMPEA